MMKTMNGRITLTIDTTVHAKEPLLYCLAVTMSPLDALEEAPTARAIPTALQRIACQQPRERKHTVMATAKMMAGKPYSELPRW